MEPLGTQEERRLLEETYTATFCTTNPNGTIQAIPIRYRHDGESFWIVTGADQRKTRNLEREEGFEPSIPGSRGATLYPTLLTPGPRMLRLVSPL